LDAVEANQILARARALDGAPPAERAVAYEQALMALEDLLAKAGPR
jgi:hypothetical protein